MQSHLSHFSPFYSLLPRPHVPSFTLLLIGPLSPCLPSIFVLLTQDHLHTPPPSISSPPTPLLATPATTPSFSPQLLLALHFQPTCLPPPISISTSSTFPPHTSLHSYLSSNFFFLSLSFHLLSNTVLISTFTSTSSPHSYLHFNLSSNALSSSLHFDLHLFLFPASIFTSASSPHSYLRVQSTG